MIAVRPRRLLVAALLLASSLFLAGVSSASTITIGNDVINRGGIDTCVGCSFALSTPFTGTGTVTSWSFYANPNFTAGNSLTPLLYTESSGIFTITGIGTTVTPLTSGAYTYSFGAVSGSASFTTPTYFGYFDGTLTPTGNAIPGNPGTIAFTDGASSGALMYYFGDGGGWPNPVPAVGEPLTPGTVDGGLLPRNYSLAATAVAVPEPSTWILLVGCLSILLCWRRGYLRLASVR